MTYSATAAPKAARQPRLLSAAALTVLLVLACAPQPAAAQEKDSASKPVTSPAKKPAQKKTAVEKTDNAAAELTAASPSGPTGATAIDSGETLAVKDTDEGKALPDYPVGGLVSVGKMQTYIVREEDTFLDIARHFGLGYVELRAANPGVDPWAPPPGSSLVIPTLNLLPRARQEGIVVNLGKMRLYYYRDAGKPPLTFAIGIGREGLETPVGDSTIVRKAANPGWYPTPRMREEKPWLPAAVPPGPSNPLGTHALYLGWPTFLIHGSNKPWGIGRRVSSGCMRMYPEDIVSLFGMTPVGTKVSVVDQPILVAWLEDGLYLEANPTQTQSNEIEIDGTFTEKPLTDEIRRMITEAAGTAAGNINWRQVERIVRERRGHPQLIAPLAARQAERQAAPVVKYN